MTEAKDWAGELISGQTTTGRILVSFILFFTSELTFSQKDCLKWRLAVTGHRRHVSNIT